MNYKFVMVDSVSGSDKMQWILAPPVIVGRCPTAGITITDRSISRRHCEFSVNSEGALVVRDLGSTNGIYIDEQRVDKAIVRPGSTVRIGAVTLRPEWTDESVVMPVPVQTFDVDATQQMKAIGPDGKPKE